MLLCVAGDIHGALDWVFANILAFDAALSVRFDWILHVGGKLIAPPGPPESDNGRGAIRCSSHLGGFLNFYSREAA